MWRSDQRRQQEKLMRNLSGHYWFVWLRGKAHLTTIDIDRTGPNPETLCGQSSLGRKGQTGTGDTGTGMECQTCLKKAGYIPPFPAAKKVWPSPAICVAYS